MNKSYLVSAAIAATVLASIAGANVFGNNGQDANAVAPVRITFAWDGQHAEMMPTAYRPVKRPKQTTTKWRKYTSYADCVRRCMERKRYIRKKQERNEKLLVAEAQALSTQCA